MKRPLRYIRQHLSLRLGLIITLIIAVAFTLLSDILFERCRHFIQRAAIDHASQLLDNTAERITGIMDETELVTNFMARTVPSHLTPDSLLAYSRRGVEDYDFLTGLAISMEPYFFPEMGRYYSAYSLRGPDSITTVREGPFEYFDAVWYKTPRSLGTSCWTDAFDDYNEGTLSSPDIMTSYCCPMRDAEGRYIGSITASLTLKWLSASVSSLKPYPNSSAIMIGRAPRHGEALPPDHLQRRCPRIAPRHRAAGPRDDCREERHGRNQGRRPRRVHLLPSVGAHGLEHRYRLP